ncbi:MAG: RNA polymerase sigma factor [Bacteroidota bacterium]
MAEKLDILLRGCRRGDRKSQEQLYRQFSAAMFGLCLRYASGREDAEDILQEGFIRVFEKLSQVKNPEAFPGWIRRVMINTALEKYRSEVVLQKVQAELKEQPVVAKEEAFDQLTAEELTGLIGELTPKYRMVFNLYAIEGYNHKEISEMLGISEGTSKSNLSRARAILQERIKKLYGTAVLK